MFAIDDQIIDRARTGDDYLQPLLAAVHRSPHHRPRCLCSASETGGVDMYVARIGGRYVLKRMPGTGPHHAPICPSYTPPAELTGLAPLLGTAIREQPSTGVTRLALGFPLSRSVGRERGGGSADAATAATDTDETKLSLRALLHFLWEEAEFTRWVPGMAGRRNWPAIRKHILAAAEAKIAKTRDLRELLWLPEPFTVADKFEIAARRGAVFTPLASARNNRKLMLALGEVKDIAPARFGRSKLIIKHAPDCPFLVEPELHAHLRRAFTTELALRQGIPDSKLIALLTFGVTGTGVAVADQVAVMTVTAQWIPFESVFEHTLLSELIAHQRRFTKSLRYNQHPTSPLASLVLTDTAPPTACFVTSATTTGAPPAEDADVPLRHWIWNTSVAGMPELPAAIHRTSRTRHDRMSAPDRNTEEANDHNPTYGKEAPLWPIPHPATLAANDSTKPGCTTTSGAITHSLGCAAGSQSPTPSNADSPLRSTPSPTDGTARPHPGKTTGST